MTFIKLFFKVVIAAMTIGVLTSNSVADELMENEFPELTAEAREAKQNIIAILDGEEFHQLQTETGWRLKNVDDTEDDPTWDTSIANFFRWLFDVLEPVGNLLKFFFQFIEVMLWVLLFIIIALVIYHFRKPLMDVIRPTDNNDLSQDQPAVMFGLEVTRESLPEDIPTTVRDLWRQGQLRAAVSLLYRALLSELIHSHNFAFTDSLTEGECVELVEKRGVQAISAYTLALTQCWQQLAYGHLTPEQQTVENLCNQWSEVFHSE